MTKTCVLTVLAVAIAPVAMAQTIFVAPAPRVPRAPVAAPARTPAPAPMPAPAIAIGAPFAAPPAPPEAPQAPLATVPPPPMPAPVFEPFDVHLDDIDFDALQFENLHFDFDQSLQALGQTLGDLKESLKEQKFDLKAQQKGPFTPVPPQPPFFRSSEDASYDQARSMIERDQYDRALPVLDRVIQAKGSRVDAALYWKAYSLSKLARRAEALTVLSDLQKEFPNGAWVRDARSLEVEVRQASGQSVAADMPDDEVKVLALRGLMQSDPEAAVPAIERILQGSSSVRVKDRALFVLSQNRTTRARDIISGVAANGSNPELRLSAVRYLGMRQDPESLKTLADLYSSQTDLDVRRAILRSLGAAQARDRLLAVAKTEKTPELRAMAVQQLGAARGSAELEELYRSETDKEVKQRILQSFIAANAADKLAAIARSEKDPDLQRMAIRNLGATNRPEAIDALRAIYLSDAPIETKRAVINALSVHQDCSALVALAKAEKNKELQTAIISQLANQSNRCPEARDYMLELLK